MKIIIRLRNEKLGDIAYLDLPIKNGGLEERQRIQHKLRVKEVIYGYRFSRYNPGMNFNHLSHLIIVDNRTLYEIY